MSTQTYHLPAGHKLTAVSTAPTTGSLWRMTGAVPWTPIAIAAAGSAGVGPFADARTYAVESINGELAVTVAASDDKPLGINPTTIPADRTETIPADHQLVIFGTLTVNGLLTVNGELRVATLPAVT